MPVKHGLLALLAEAPAHGYQLKSEFEARTGGSWELNIGQVYSTLQRLERDGLVTAAAADADERRIHEITAAGRAALDRWYQTPIVAAPPPRDELAIKVLLALASPEVDVAVVIQRQRTAVIEYLQSLTRRKRDLDLDRDLPAVLHIDALVFKAEAEVRWLDTCEVRLRNRPPTQATRDGPAARGEPAPDRGRAAPPSRAS